MIVLIDSQELKMATQTQIMPQTRDGATKMMNSASFVGMDGPKIPLVGHIVTDEDIGALMVITLALYLII